MSLRMKVSVAFLATLLASMGINFVFAFDLFKKDKTSAVFEALGSISRLRAEAASLRMERLALLTPQAFASASQGASLLAEGLEFAARYRRRGDVYEPGDSWEKGAPPDSAAARAIEDAIAGLESSPASVESIDEKRVALAFRSLRPGPAAGADDVWAAIAEKSSFAKWLGADGGSEWLDHRGESLLPKPSLPASARAEIAERFRAAAIDSWQGECDERARFVAAARAGFGGTIAVQSTFQAEAFALTRKLALAFGLMFVLVLFASLATGVGAASSVSATLGDIARAADGVGRGNFDVRVEQRTADEAGKLAVRFNRLVGELRDAMAARAEKVRTEGEQRTSKAVRDLLFQPERASVGGARIAAFSSVAPECGGDWWGYSRAGGRALVFIGDAAGSGPSAALTVSAVRSAVAIAAKLGVSNPSEIMSTLNAAVCEASRGAARMTFFVASIDEATGETFYCNAGHCAPAFLPGDLSGAGGEALRRLDSAICPVLGEAAESAYASARVLLRAGDGLFLFTDGLFNLLAPDGETYGEREAFDAVVRAAIRNPAPDAMADRIREEVESFRLGAALSDDVSFLVVRRAV